MILIADENVQRTVVEGLRQKGHDVRHIQQVTPGVPDEAVLDMANRESAVLLTYDRDLPLLSNLVATFGPPPTLAHIDPLVWAFAGVPLDELFTFHDHPGGTGEPTRARYCTR